MKIILAPDSFKGNMTALEVASALEKGIKRVLPDAECVKVPMADGGEGTVRSLLDAKGGKLVRKRVMGPAGKPVSARYGMLADGKTAVIEIAEACGLPMVEGTNDKNPLKTTSYGVGQLMLDAVRKGVRHIILGLGGSATTDAGAGMAQALGVVFLDRKKHPIKTLGSGCMLHRVHGIDASATEPAFKRIKVSAATDVKNPLCGKKGAAYIFGPQKGATPAMVEKLDSGLRHFAAVIDNELHKKVLRIPGAGAAGGLGAGLVAFVDAELRSGIDVIIEAVELERHIGDAELVITGEGRVDQQTAFGKTPMGVAEFSSRYHVPTVVIGGSVADDAHNIFAHGIDGLASAYARDMPLREALKHSKAYLANSAERVIRLILIGKRLAMRDKYAEKG